MITRIITKKIILKSNLVGPSYVQVLIACIQPNVDQKLYFQTTVGNPQEVLDPTPREY